MRDAGNQLGYSLLLTLSMTGARISEVLALTASRIDKENGAVVFETLKRRRKGVFRAVPVPGHLIQKLQELECPVGQRLWPWCRTTVWAIVKKVMREAGISEALCKPRSLRHTFAVQASQKGVPLNIIQRWLGHARIETTAIYADALGVEERTLARRIWR